MTALALMATAPVAASPGDAFREWIGSCFETQITQDMRDMHCFTGVPEGKLVMDVHKVRDAEGHFVYEGVTVYTPGDGKIVYAYSNSLGQVMPGDVVRAGDTLQFGIMIAGKQEQLSWTWTGDGYDVVSGSRTSHFRKVSYAADGL